MIRKCLAVGIILLFIGVTIAPTINFNTVKASIDDDLVEVTTQACGIEGYGDTTVKLTREQYQNLELFLVEFRARLNQTSTREEAVPIFKEAVVELDKYGLLPRGMSVEKAQQLLTKDYSGKRFYDGLVKPQDDNDSHFQEQNCIIAGRVKGIYPFSIGGLIGVYLLGFLDRILFNLFDLVAIIPLLIYIYLWAIPFVIHLLIPFKFFNMISIGSTDGPSMGRIDTWTKTNHLNISGSFYGSGNFYTGVFGFTGISIFLMPYHPFETTSIFFGTALRVDVQSA